MNLAEKLVLGTAQFGMNYGAFNASGKIDPNSANAILAEALENGISFLDTARAYGDSENSLGNLVATPKFNIVTKCPPLSSSLDPAHALKESFDASRQALGVKKIYGYLLHSADDLTGKNSEAIWAALTKLREEGLVEKIGVSAYTSTEVIELLDRFPLTLVQLPAHILSKWIYDKKTKSTFSSNAVEVHTRSTFLQGFLLANPESLPPHLKRWKDLLVQFKEQAQALGAPPLNAALAAITAQPMIDKVVVGVDNLKQFSEIIKAVQDTTIAPNTFENLACSDIELVDPRYWK